MTIRGVLFDFSGTLFNLEYESLFGGLLVSHGVELDTEGRTELRRRLTAPVGPAEWLPERFHEAWARRDLDSVLHRRVYVEIVRRSGLGLAGLAEKFYDGMIDPSNWQPYPDTVAALRLLATARIPVAVVSNIGWDIRTVLAHHGASGLVTAFALSYEEGRTKPDPALFRLACERIGIPPEQALMIGDSTETDGGAEAVGSRVVIVDPLPTVERPGALLAALAEHGYRACL